MTLYVNGEKIEDQAIQAEAEKLRPQYEQVFAEMPEDQRERQLQEWSRENVIEAVLMRQAARRDIEQPPAEAIQQAFEHLTTQAGGREEFYQSSGLSPDQEDQIKDDLARRMQVERLIGRVTAAVGKPGDKDIKKHYEKNLDRYTIPEMIRAAHIVKHATPAADMDEARKQLDEALAKLRDGAAFADIAREYSDCPDNGGDLGYFARGQMVPEFDEIVFNLDTGRVSDVFSTQFGLHIATVVDRRPASPCPLAEVREVITKDLTEQAQQRAIEKFIDAEKEKATIEDK